MSPRARSLVLFLRDNSGWLFPSIAMIVGGILTYSAVNHKLDNNDVTDARQDKDIEELRKDFRAEAEKTRAETKEVTASISEIKQGQARMEGKLDIYIRLNNSQTVSVTR